MHKDLFYNTVTPSLLKILKKLMAAKELGSFRLVGGTSLSLQRGHRRSIDIDLFTDATYGSLDFNSLDKFLKDNYAYIDTSMIEEIGMGRSYFIGNNKDNAIKLDIFYTDPFVFPALEIDGIRLAPVEEIIAMKLDVVSRGGRKKDFWDLHELTGDYSLKAMLALHRRRYSYAHDAKLIKKHLADFSIADEEPDPECLRGNIWELIKLDMIDFSKT